MNTNKEAFFQEYEKESNRKFRTFAETKQHTGTTVQFDYTFRPEKSRYDVKCISGDTKFIWELKTRQDFDNSFFLKDGYGMWLEFDKYSSLLEAQEGFKEKKNLDVNILYSVFTKNGLIIYQLSSNPEDYTWYNKKLPKSKYEPNVMVWKKITDLYSPVEILTLKF